MIRQRRDSRLPVNVTTSTSHSLSENIHLSVIFSHQRHSLTSNIHQAEVEKLQLKVLSNSKLHKTFTLKQQHKYLSEHVNVTSAVMILPLIIKAQCCR